MKNIFNQLKDEETLQGYATKSHKKEQFQQKTREKKSQHNKAAVSLCICAFVGPLIPGKEQPGEGWLFFSAQAGALRSSAALSQSVE